MENHETWQVEVAGNIYETDFAGLTQWIAESSLLPDDKVRCGNKPWIEAKHVPALTVYFAGKPPLASDSAVNGGGNYNSAEPQGSANTTVSQSNPSNFGSTTPTTSTGYASPHQTEPVPEKTTAPPVKPAQKNAKNCAVHADQEAAYACRQCLSLFCEGCPRTMARVKICPLCGDMCNPLGAPQTLKSSAGTRQYGTGTNRGGNSSYVDPNFTFEDFKTAWSYPFRFPLALIAGGILTSLLSLGMYLGLATTMVGGLFPGLMTVLVCGVLSISIIYGCATKTVNQVAYGNTKETFMPDTEDFGIWNTILKPCFLGLSTCLISWGPMLLVGLLIFKTLSSISADAQKKMNGLEVPKQNQQLLMTPDDDFAPQDELETEVVGNSRRSEAHAVKRIQALQKTAPGSPMGFTPQKSPDEMQSEMVANFIEKAAGRLVPLILVMLLAALWGLFYFPTALTVAGYTDSIGSTMNPLVGFDTMRRMGGNYFKAFGTYLLLLVFSFFIYFGVGIATSPLAAMGLGQVPAQFIGNIVSFYLYIVIGCIFGLALYRSHEKLGFAVN